MIRNLIILLIIAFIVGIFLSIPMWTIEHEYAVAERIEAETHQIAIEALTFQAKSNEMQEWVVFILLILMIIALFVIIFALLVYLAKNQY